LDGTVLVLIKRMNETEINGYSLMHCSLDVQVRSVAKASPPSFLCIIERTLANVVTSQPLTHCSISELRDVMSVLGGS